MTNSIKYGIIVLLFFGVLVGTAHAQVSVEKAIEFPIDEDGIGTTVVLGENGIVIFGIDKEKGDKVLTLQHYSTDLKAITSDKQVLNRYQSYYYSQNLVSEDQTRFYIVIIEVGGNAKLVEYSTISRKITTRNIEVPRKVIIKDMILVKDQIFFNYRSGGIDHLAKFDIEKDKFSKVDLPGAKERREVNNLYFVDGNREHFSITARYGKSKVNKNFEVYIFNSEGDRVELPMQLNDVSNERYILDASVTQFDDATYMVSGSYTVVKKGVTSVTTGIYLAEFSGKKNSFIKFYSFSDMENFNSYMSEKSQAKVDRKVSKAKARGKEDVIKALAVNHPIIQGPNGFTFVSEIFYPTYRTEAYTTYVNGRPVTQYRSVFDGYQYSHAVVLSLDLEGNMIWNKTFSMYLETKPFTVVKNLRIVEQDHSLTLNFTTGSKFKKMTIIDNDIVEEVKGELPPLKDGDLVRALSFSRVLYWYDNYYVTYGYQMIKNKTEERGNRRRSVFYVRKVQVL